MRASYLTSAKLVRKSVAVDRFDGEAEFVG